MPTHVAAASGGILSGLVAARRLDRPERLRRHHDCRTIPSVAPGAGLGREHPAHPVALALPPAEQKAGRSTTRAIGLPVHPLGHAGLAVLAVAAAHFAAARQTTSERSAARATDQP